ncbi:MAG: PRD domain-containing protein [Eubacteriales bacterium]|nr:PRD domain-containing protein [Eubacteriales bacterium]
MYIYSVINNNVVSSRDENNEEVILTGRGIGFQKRNGQLVEKEKIEKIFRLENEAERERLKGLLTDMPLEYVQVTDQIISYARKVLDSHISQSVYLMLIDHIGFAIERVKKGMDFQNALYEEVRRFYPEEYMIGCHALNLIEQTVGVRLPKDEAASVALHLVNAEFDMKTRDIWKMTNMLREMMTLVETELGISEGESLRKDRLVANMKFLAHRLLLESPQKENVESEFFEFIRQYCKKEYNLTQKVKQYIEEHYDCEMTQAEQLYLAIDFKRTEEGQDQKGGKCNGII